MNKTSKAVAKKPCRKSGAPKGNKNAIGNSGGAPPGNSNARKHGGYSRVYLDSLSDEEWKMIQEAEHDEEELLIGQIDLLSVRERRIMHSIKRYQDMPKGNAVTETFRSEEKREFDSSDEKERYEEMRDKRIASGDLLPGRPYHSSTRVEPAENMILKLEEALTRCQDIKRRCIEALIRLRTERGDFGHSSAADDWVAAVLLSVEAEKDE